jgi:hypothetical protein
MPPRVATAIRLLYGLDIQLLDTSPAIVNVVVDFDSLTYHARLYSEPNRVQIGALDDRIIIERLDDDTIKVRFYATNVVTALASVAIDVDDYSATILYNNSGFTILNTQPIFPLLATGAQSITLQTVLRQVFPPDPIDGVNRVFTLPSEPAPNTALWVYKNGLFMTPDVDFTISSNIITFAVGNAPPLGSNVYVTYFEAA